MAIVQTLGQGDFVQMFKQSSRKDQFSVEALEAIFNYLDTYSEETGENVEFDIVSICCDWAEMTWNEIASSYDVDLSQCVDDDERIEAVKDFLSEETQFVELSECSFVFLQF